MRLILASQKLSYPYLYFSNGNHFGYFLYVPLLPAWSTFIFGTVMHLHWATYKRELCNCSQYSLNYENLKSFTFCTFEFTCTVCLEPHITMNSLCWLQQCIRFICERFQMSSGPHGLFLL